MKIRKLLDQTNEVSSAMATKGRLLAKYEDKIRTRQQDGKCFKRLLCEQRDTITDILDDMKNIEKSLETANMLISDIFPNIKRKKYDTNEPQ